MTTEFRINIYDAPRYFLFFISSFILLNAIFFGLAIILKSPVIGGIGWAIICILIFIFAERTKNWFTNKYLLEFSSSSFFISKFDKDNNIFVDKISINWSEIKSYIFFIDGTNTVLTVYFKEKKDNKKWAGWCFKEYKTFNDSIKGDSIFDTFNKHVKTFNLHVDSENKILYSMGFLNSRTGTIMLYATLFILVGGFIFHLLVHPQSSILTLLLGPGLLISQFIKRSQYRKMYNEISK